MREFTQFNESRPKYEIDSFNAPYNRISAVFNKVTNSYKYYWFWAILELLNEKKEHRISYEELSLKMLDFVWYPLTYFKLSFGKQDSFNLIAERIRNKLPEFSSEQGAPQISKQLKQIDTSNKIASQIAQLIRYVPYRFLTPFFSNELRGLSDGKKNKKIKQLANQSMVHNVPYKFYDNGIIIKDGWLDFFKSYQKILQDFIHRNLIAFLQKHNPNVIGISSKLIKPEKRELEKQRKLFRSYMQYKKDVKCLYSKMTIDKVESIDHFIPWSYVVHDHIWNLVPVSGVANASKSNRIPDFNLYFKPFIELQFDVANFIFSNYKRGEFIDSYGSVLKNESLTSIEHFNKCYKDLFTPLKINATNLGFEGGWVFQK